MRKTGTSDAKLHTKKPNGYLSTWSYFKVTDGRFETSSNKDSVTIVFLEIGLVFREQLFWKTT